MCNPKRIQITGTVIVTEGSKILFSISQRSVFSVCLLTLLSFSSHFLRESWKEKCQKSHTPNITFDASVRWVPSMPK